MPTKSTSIQSSQLNTIRKRAGPQICQKMTHLHTKLQLTESMILHLLQYLVGYGLSPGGVLKLFLTGVCSLRSETTTHI